MHYLLAILSRYPGDCQPSQIEPLGSASGMSGATFWRLTTPRGQVALRRWPAEHPTSDRLRFIHAVLIQAERRGITFIPVPIAAKDGATFIEHGGHLWELAPWMPGAADYVRDPNVEKLRAALTAIAQFHVGTCDFTPIPITLSVGGNAESIAHSIAATFTATPHAPSPNINRRLERLSALAHSGIDELSRAINSSIWPELVPLARQFLELLPRALPRAIAQLAPLASVPVPLQPCLRDIWHDHILFTGDEVTGMIDFGALDIDTPAGDVARLVGSLVGDDPAGWQTGLAAYSAIRPLSEQESLAVFALDTSGTIIAGCNWIRWIYIDRRQFEKHDQVIARFRRIVARAKHCSG